MLALTVKSLRRLLQWLKLDFSMEASQLDSCQLLCSCLKLSTYSFVYRECDLLQNEKVRHKSSTQIQICSPAPFLINLWSAVNEFVAGSMQLWRAAPKQFERPKMVFGLTKTSLGCHLLVFQLRCSLPFPCPF